MYGLTRRSVLQSALLGAVLLGTAALLVALWPARSRRASGPLPQEAYVWQRSWAPEVLAAIAAAGQASDLEALVVLAAEVDLAARPPRVARAAVDFAALRAYGRPVGLALRIGSFERDRQSIREPAQPPFYKLARLAGSLAQEAHAQGVRVREIQLDYDCPESRLDEYPALVRAVRAAVAPAPVTITALPSWLRHRRAFAALAEAADGYVLQVHSLEAPRSADARVELCDPEAARRAVETAARFRRRFWVALPTYGYVVAFSPKGKILGLSAEGPVLSWPRNAVVRLVRSNPEAMAGLVRAWTADRPAELAGVIWYRLPTASDRLNWSWPAFRAVRQGRAPRHRLEVHRRETAPGLVDVELVNTGEADAGWPPSVEFRWGEGELVAADGLAGYRVLRDGPGRLRFERDTSPWDRPLRPGERRTIGWLRAVVPSRNSGYPFP